MIESIRGNNEAVAPYRSAAPPGSSGCESSPVVRPRTRLIDPKQYQLTKLLQTRCYLQLEAVCTKQSIQRRREEPRDRIPPSVLLSFQLHSSDTILPLR